MSKSSLCEFDKDSLFAAAGSGDVEEMRTLLAKAPPGSVNAKTTGYDSYTLLYEAASSGELDMVKLLVEEFGANVNLPSYSSSRFGNYMIPLNAAVKACYPRCDSDPEGDDKDPLRVVRYLISQGSEVNFQKGYSPLIDSVETENVELVRFLLSQGADVNPRRTMANALYYAVLMEAFPTVKILLEAGSRMHCDTWSVLSQKMYDHGEEDFDSLKEIVIVLLLQQTIIDDGKLRVFCEAMEEIAEGEDDVASKMAGSLRLYLDRRSLFVEQFGYEEKFRLERPLWSCQPKVFLQWPKVYQRFVVFCLFLHRQSDCPLSRLTKEIVLYEILPYFGLYAVVCAFREERDNEFWWETTDDLGDEGEDEEEEEEGAFDDSF